MNQELYQRLLSGQSLIYACKNRALWRLTGTDRTRYLNGQVTQEVAKLSPGHVTYAAVCNAKGRMEGDVFITAQTESYFLDADLSLRESLGARLEKYLIADDAAFEDLTEIWALYHCFGPLSPQTEGFIATNNRFGWPGHDLWLPHTATLAGGDFVADDLVETLRLEAGLPRWGAELEPTTLPPEAGLEARAISYTKGCYVGQETIARIKSIGHVNRCLVFLRSENEQLPQVGDKLSLAEKEVGVITSAGFSPRLGKGIALGYVQRNVASHGTAFMTSTLTLTVSQPL